jgi:hypothetical protein
MKKIHSFLNFSSHHENLNRIIEKIFNEKKKEVDVVFSSRIIYEYMRKKNKLKCFLRFKYLL